MVAVDTPLGYVTRTTRIPFLCGENVSRLHVSTAFVLWCVAEWDHDITGDEHVQANLLYCALFLKQYSIRDRLPYGLEDNTADITRLAAQTQRCPGRNELGDEV